MRDQAELKRIALGIFEGRVFHPGMCRTPEDVPLIWPLLPMLERADLDDLCAKLDAGGTIFEWMDKAGPMAVNGYSMFWSFSVLTVDEVAVVEQTVRKVAAAIEAI